MIIDAVVMLADQTRQVKDACRAHISLQMFCADSQQDRGADQARWDGIDIARHSNRGKTGHGDPQLLAWRKRCGGQWAPRHVFLPQASCSRLGAVVTEIRVKV